MAIDFSTFRALSAAKQIETDLFSALARAKAVADDESQTCEVIDIFDNIADQIRTAILQHEQALIALGMTEPVTG